jgi:hypothetical protein
VVLMTDLFPELAPKHNPGGKTLPMLPGMWGDALFYGDNDQYRVWLSRFWGDARGPYGLSIGMNPSTAAHHVDDATIRRDIHFMKRASVCGFYKVNVMDYRSTKPQNLLLPAVAPRSKLNLPKISELAAGASIIFVCWGSLHPKLQKYGDAVAGALESQGHDLMCLGKTANGNPKHPLYISGDTPLVRFER